MKRCTTCGQPTTRGHCGSGASGTTCLVCWTDERCAAGAIQLVKRSSASCEKSKRMDRDLFGGRRGEYELPEIVHPVTCRSCGAAMVFIKTANGKMLPLSIATIEERDGKRYALAHFSDCPQAKEWSKR